MSNQYTFYLDDLIMTVYAHNKIEAKEKFDNSICKSKATVKNETIDECIAELNNYIKFPMTDEYVIRECITVLEQLKEKNK